MTLQDALFVLAVLAVVLTGSVAVIVYASFRIGERARLRRRIGVLLREGAAVAARAADSSDRRRRRSLQARVRELDAPQRRSRRADALRTELLQSGLNWSLRRFAVVSAASGLTGFALPLLLGFRPLGSPLIAAIPIALVMGLGAPRWVVRYLGRRRLDKFTRHFADSVDLIIRGIQSGLPVAECLSAIGREAPEPVSTEFRLITEGERLGIALDELLRRAIERVPTAEFKFFAIVLGIQRQTGGNLSETLQNLSNVLRERDKLRSAVKAASSEARASAVILGSLPFFVMMLLYLVNRDYLALLFTDPLGHVLLAFAATILGLGFLIMRKMINFEI